MIDDIDEAHCLASAEEFLGYLFPLILGTGGPLREIHDGNAGLFGGRVPIYLTHFGCSNTDT